MILTFIADNYIWVLLAILLVNLFQRRYVPRSLHKRMASLILAILAMVFQILITLIITRGLSHSLAFVALIVVVAAAFPFRRKLLIFRRTCPSCSAPLDWKTILYFDDNLCPTCWDELHPSEDVEHAQQEPVVEPHNAQSVDEIDWDEWEPTEKAVLLYLFEGDQVLLIEKKTGFGKGKTTAPGGHIEEGETASEAAIREMKEETHISVDEVLYKGQLEFQFTDGLAMRGYVFFAYSYSGTPTETVEARPFWAPVDNLPYDEMWKDDRNWLPIALSGKEFKARFIFDGDDMLSSDIKEIDPATSS